MDGWLVRGSRRDRLTTRLREGGLAWTYARKLEARDGNKMRADEDVVGDGRRALPTACNDGEVDAT